MAAPPRETAQVEFRGVDVDAYFKDLSAELSSVKNRIRHFIKDRHWASDGAWKESALRSVIRGYLPSSFCVGTGFFVTDADCSSQIDLLIYDDQAPVLFRDGDFVIVPAYSVRAAIEVKTELDARADIQKALEKLNAIAALLDSRDRPMTNPFVGLFAYEAASISCGDMLRLLKAANAAQTEISAVCFGDAQFVRYWENPPGAKMGPRYDSWHAYNLPERSRGYFIHNIIQRLFPIPMERAENVWYPPQGKEPGEVARAARRSEYLEEFGNWAQRG